MTVCFSSDDATIITAGVKHVNFWTFNGKSLKKRKGLFGREAKIQTVLAAAPLGDKFVTAMKDGTLALWQGRECIKSEPAHEGDVYALFSSGDTLYSGGRDGVVRMFGMDL